MWSIRPSRWGKLVEEVLDGNMKYEIHLKWCRNVTWSRAKDDSAARVQYFVRSALCVALPLGLAFSGWRCWFSVALLFGHWHMSWKAQFFVPVGGAGRQFAYFCVAGAGNREVATRAGECRCAVGVGVLGRASQRFRSDEASRFTFLSLRKSRTKCSRVVQKNLTRVSYNGPTRDRYKSVLQERLARLSHNSVWQHCPTRRPYKGTFQARPTRLS